MKIAYICSDGEIPLLGSEGCSIHVRELTDALVAAGHEVLILCAWLGDGGAAFPASRVECLVPSGIAAAVWDLLDQDPVVLESNLERDLRSVLFNAWLPRSADRILAHEQPDVIYERYSLFGTAGVELARERGIPLILEVNTRLCLEQQGYVKFPLARTAELLEPEILSHADAVVAVSESLREWIVSLGVDEHRVHVIPNAVSRDRFDRVPADAGAAVRAEYGLDGSPIVGFVGSFQPWHDVQGLLQAFARVRKHQPETRLMLVGEGSAVAEIQSLSDRLGVSSAVVCVGHVPHEYVPRFISAMDIVVAPYDGSVDLGFLPIKLFEYMAAGRATVAAGVGEIPRFIEDGVTGCVYPPGDDDALASTLVDVLGDVELRARLGSAARAMVLGNFTWDVAAAKVARLAEELLER